MKKYRLVRELGKGGTSRVYLGIDRRSGKRYAIKKYEGMSGYASAEEEFQRMRGIRHPGIPIFWEGVEEPGGGALVMEYVPGITLKERIARYVAVREVQAVGWGIGICRILAFLQWQRPPVIYRDLKPSNIMITPLSQVKLIDFGASVGAEGGKGHVDIPVGTKGYAAPEQFVRGGTIDMRTDMYGFGAVMLYMLTGQSPSGAGGNWFRVLADGTAISKSLKTVLSRCVQPDPNRRYRCFEEIERDMENPESVLVSHKKTEFRILRSDLRF